MNGPIIERWQIECASCKINAFAFLPTQDKNFMPKAIACFTHGYTSHKGSLINWGGRLVKDQIPTVIFDLPGHFIGSFDHYELKSFEEFTQNAHLLFEAVTKKMLTKYKNFNARLIYGGHSLGAVLAIKALDENLATKYQALAITVGLGSPPKNGHALQGPFFADILEIRSQLVSPILAPDITLNWIEEEKNNLKIRHKTIHLISGQNDIIVPSNGLQDMVKQLQEQDNNVSYDYPKSLPHHMPEKAIPFIRSFLKKEGLLL